MSIHIHQVLDYLDANPVCRHDGEIISLMELLHDAYTMHNAIDSEQLRGYFRKLRCHLEPLTQTQADELFCTVCDLCLEHEQLAFSHGIVVGMHLMTEVNYLP